MQGVYLFVTLNRDLRNLRASVCHKLETTRITAMSLRS